MRSFICCVFILALMTGIPASAEEEIEGAIGDETTGFKIHPLTEIIDYNRSNNIENGFSTHRTNYFLPVAVSDCTQNRKDKEVKFQISVKQRVVRFYGWAFYLAYTQKSFWQAYDKKNSFPFRENNFNPELFIRTKMWIGIRADLGIEHESNGQKLPYSRSWNRIYLSPYYENDYFICSLKAWYRLKEKKKKEEMDNDGDDNPDIARYYGYSELNLTAKFPSLRNIWLSGIFRYNPKWNKGSAEINLTMPMITNSMKWMVQYLEGYGESLIDYNIRQRKIGFGVCFTR
ncbi:MAG: phospholipase A [Spirochaetota bacterium]